MDHHARHAAALLLVTTAVIHIDLVPEHLREAPYAGILFALLAASTLLLAGLVLVRDQPSAWTVTGAISLAAIAGYALSRTVGLPSMDDDVGDWLNPLGVVAVCAETLTVLISLRCALVRTTSRTMARGAYGTSRPGGPGPRS
jgi:hypothetical protein